MKIICVGRNYKNHAKELGNEVPTQPVLFLKPDTALLKGNEFYIPEFTKDLHYELEVVVKISKVGKYIQQENAHKHYEEIGLGIDFTARDLQSELKAKGLPWEISKGFDGSAVVSTFFKKENYALTDLNFSLLKNGQQVQKGNTSSMLFEVDELIAYASKFFTLRVGDLLFTGTPEGVGPVVESDYLEGYLESEKLLDLRIS
ncbi:fumarylacetoacetate hydrolase family protein [Chryseobacterium sp. A301]